MSKTETETDIGITLPILDKMHAPQKVIGHVHIKNSADLPDFPDFCLALGFNRKGVSEYTPRVFVIVDDMSYLDAISKLSLPTQMLIEKTKQEKDAGTSG